MTERGRDRDKETFHPLAHSPSGLNIQRWARFKSGVPSASPTGSVAHALSHLLLRIFIYRNKTQFICCGQVGCQRDRQLYLLSHSASHGTTRIVFSTHYLLNSSEEPEVSKLEPDKPADVITDDLENFKISLHVLHVHTQAHMCIYVCIYRQGSPMLT